MIKVKNTTFQRPKERYILPFYFRLMRTQRAYIVDISSLAMTLIFLFATAHAQPPNEIVDSKFPFSEPLAALRQLTWSAGSEGSLELSATRAEWSDERRTVNLEGDVILRRYNKDKVALTLRCKRATLSLEHEAGTAEAKNSLRLSSLRLEGPVRLSGSALSLRVDHVQWQAGQPLSLRGSISGRWRSHSIRAEEAMFWPQTGRLELKNARAHIQLTPSQSPIQAAKER